LEVWKLSTRLLRSRRTPRRPSPGRSRPGIPNWCGWPRCSVRMTPRTSLTYPVWLVSYLVWLVCYPINESATLVCRNSAGDRVAALLLAV
jgi:hypothetical protein